MKKTTTFTAFLFLAITLFTSCSSPQESDERSSKNLIVEQVSTYAYGVSFITNTGDLWVTGSLIELLKGYNVTNSHPPVFVDSNVTHVSTGYGFVIYLKNDGSVWGFGGNSSNQLGNISKYDIVHKPTEILSRDDGAIKVAAGRSHSVILKKDSSVWAAGNDMDGQLGTNSGSYNFLEITGETCDIYAGYQSSFYIKNDSSFFAAGDNMFSQLGIDSDGKDLTTPTYISEHIIKATSNYYQTLYLNSSGELLASGRNTNHVFGVEINDTSRVLLEKIYDGVIDVELAGNHCLILLNDGTLIGMGQNETGALGSGGQSPESGPVQISTNVQKISAGDNITTFIKDDGTLWGIGNNHAGQLGSFENIMTLNPVQIQ